MAEVRIRHDARQRKRAGKLVLTDRGLHNLLDGHRLLSPDETMASFLIRLRALRAEMPEGARLALVLTTAHDTDIVLDG